MGPQILTVIPYSFAVSPLTIRQLVLHSLLVSSWKETANMRSLFTITIITQFIIHKKQNYEVAMLIARANNIDGRRWQIRKGTPTNLEHSKKMPDLYIVIYQ